MKDGDEVYIMMTNKSPEWRRKNKNRLFCAALSQMFQTNAGMCCQLAAVGVMEKNIVRYISSYPGNHLGPLRAAVSTGIHFSPEQ